MITCNETIYQWDVFRTVDVDTDCEVHFALKGEPQALVVASALSKAEIPNVLLQDGRDIIAWQVQEDKTVETKRIAVERRAKPSDYVHTEQEFKTYELLEKEIKELAKKIDGIEPGKVELPIASVSTLGGVKVGENLTIAEDGTLNAPYSAKGEQGLPGAKGDKGEPGKTPVRGVDYWTESDKQEINSYIDSKIPSGGSGGSYVLPAATNTTLGGIKVGSNLSITPDGTLSATAGTSVQGNDVWEEVWYQMATAESPIKILQLTQNSKGEPLSVYKKLMVRRETTPGQSNSGWQVDFSLYDKDNQNASSAIMYMTCTSDESQIYSLNDWGEEHEVVEYFGLKDVATSSGTAAPYHLKRVCDYSIDYQKLKERAPYAFRNILIIPNVRGMGDYADAALYTKIFVWGVRK